NGEPAHLVSFIERQDLVDYPFVLRTDPSLAVYRAASLARSRWRVFGPPALFREVVVRLRGYRSYALEGDVLQQGGTALIDSRGVVQSWREAQLAAEPVDVRPMVERAVALAAGDAQGRGLIV
ncbi:MAG: AhpC/TSA family protein, partial [Myxococcota bacterium]